MKTNIAIISILLIFIGCGDEKSTGERMSDAVSKIRGDKPKPKLLIPKHSDKKIKQTTQEDPKEDNVVKKVKENKTEIDTNKSNNLSLKDLALKAKEQIKEAVEPAKELKDDMKSALSIAKESVKEVVSETKETMRETIKDTVSKAKPWIESGKDKIKDEAKKIKDLIEIDKESSKQ
jgi:hypothetical protein